WLEKRLSTLFDLARKHKVAPQDLFDLQKRLSFEFNELKTSDIRLVELSKKLAAHEKKYVHAANSLSQGRLNAAKKLALEITSTIHELSLPHAEFHIHFERDHNELISPSGLEKTIFQIKTNTG